MLVRKARKGKEMEGNQYPCAQLELNLIGETLEPRIKHMLESPMTGVIDGVGYVYSTSSRSPGEGCLLGSQKRPLGEETQALALEIPCENQSTVSETP
jgi:hypothetical protein